VRRLLHRLLTIGLIGVALNTAWWLVLGARNLRRGVPQMARADLALMRGLAPYGLAIGDIVVLDDEGAALEATALGKLRATFAHYGFTLMTEAEATAAGRFREGRCSDCLAFAYRIRFDTPVLAQVDTDQFLFSGGSSVFRHRRLWLFGAWLTLSDELSGVE
jgi:hypothetical protein